MTNSDAPFATNTEKALKLVADVASDAEIALGAAKLAKRASDAAESAKLDAEQASLTAARKLRESKPAPADPRDSPHFALLRGDDGGVFARMSPRRNRWPELGKIDERIAGIDQQQAAVAAELQEVREKRQGADVRHQIAIADWFEAGQPEPRPVSEAVELDERIASLESQHAALDIVRSRTFEERVAFVVKRRKSLVRDAEKATEERLARCLQLVDELEQARDDLVALRQTQVWAALYPSEALASDVPFGHAIVGARQSLQQKHLPGITNMLFAPNVFELLRDDAKHCATALTVEAAAAIQGTTASAISGSEAIWHDRKVELDQERRDKQKAIEQHIREWGVAPKEWA